MPVADPSREPLRRYLQLQDGFDRELIKILRQAEKEARVQLARLAKSQRVGAVVRSLQLRIAIREIQSAIAEAWRGIGNATAAGRVEASIRAVDVHKELSRALARGSLTRAELETLSVALRASAANSVELVKVREGMSRIELSQRVYRNRALSAGRVDRLVDTALAKGFSARELAKAVIGFIRPGVAGGMSYAAMRLGRTELNNAFHAQSIRSNSEYPWVESMKWNLSGSHPKPDICDTLASQTSSRRLNAGEYFTNEVPSKPHPQCLCYITPVVMNEDAFVAAFHAGKFDSWLDTAMRGPSAIAS